MNVYKECEQERKGKGEILLDWKKKPRRAKIAFINAINSNRDTNPEKIKEFYKKLKKVGYKKIAKDFLKHKKEVKCQKKKNGRNSMKTRLPY